MLVLTRKQGEKIRIGDDVVVTVVRTKGKAVRLGIQAPAHVPVLRGEIAAAIVRGQARPSTGAEPGDADDLGGTGHPAPSCCASSASVAGPRGPLRDLLDARY